MVELLRACFKVGIRRACRVLKRNRSTWYYRSKRPEQAALKKRIQEIASIRVRYGYRRIHTLLVRKGWRVNHKRVHRLYREEGLQMRYKSAKRRSRARLREEDQPG